MTTLSTAAGTQINIYTGAAITNSAEIRTLSITAPNLYFTGSHMGNRKANIFCRHPLGTAPYGAEMTVTDSNNVTSIAIAMNTWDTTSTNVVNNQNETTFTKAFNDQSNYVYLGRVVFMVADNNYSNPVLGNSNA